MRTLFVQWREYLGNKIVVDFALCESKSTLKKCASCKKKTTYIATKITLMRNFLATTALQIQTNHLKRFLQQ